MPLYTQTLRSFPTATACCAAIDALSKGYHKAHQRKPTIALCYSLFNDTHSVSLHADDIGKQTDEVLWFDRNAQSL